MSQNSPQTIIEIYDDEQIYNVLSVIEWKPQNVVYIGSRKLKNKRVKNSIISCLRSLGLDTKCFFYSTDMLNIESVTAELVNILNTFEGCAIDLTGGNEVALVAVGMLAKEYSIPLFKYDRYAYCYRSIYNFEAAESFTSNPHITVPAALALAGGIMKEHGHVSLEHFDEETAKDIFRVWTIYKKYYRAWPKAVSYLQQISRDLEPEELHVEAGSVVYGGDKITGADKNIMGELTEAGIIGNYRNDGSRVAFDYKNRLMRSCLCDTGICLELYVWAVAHKSGTYDDVQISVVIDWDGNLESRINTINEIDVMLIRGIVPVFISCKTGTVNVTVLNEIKTLAKQFGGEYARPVLVTMSNVRQRDRYLYQRALDMGVDIIDHDDLVGDKLARRLYSISKL